MWVLWKEGSGISQNSAVSEKRWGVNSWKWIRKMSKEFASSFLPHTHTHTHNFLRKIRYAFLIGYPITISKPEILN